MFPAIYPIIDTTVCGRHGIAPEDLIRACLAGGARLLQVRQKEGGSGSFLALVERALALARPFGARIVVNDRADLALAGGASGVHVGQDDLPAAAARRILGEAAIVGVSTHERAQVDETLAGPATYVAVGPIFGTATKDTGYTARGLDLVRYAAGRGKPVVAIGGITLENGRSVLDAGASSLAIIGDLLEGHDPEARTRAFLAL